MNNELTIQAKTREMMTYAFICLRQCPKHERFILCAEIRQCIYKILRLTIVASKRYHKKTTIQDLDVEIERWLFINLQLKTNHKTQVFPVSMTHGCSLDFLGYRLYTTHKLMRKCTEKRMRYKVKRLRERYKKGLASQDEVKSVIASYTGCAKHANAYNLLTNILQEPFIRESEHERV